MTRREDRHQLLGSEGERVRGRFLARGRAEPVVAADGAGMTAIRGMKSLQPAPRLNFSVSRRLLVAYSVPACGSPQGVMLVN